MAQQKGPNEDLVLGALITFVVGGISLLLWYAFDTELKDGLRFLRLMQIKATMLVYGPSYTVDIPGFPPQKLGVWDRFLSNVNPDDIRFREIEAMTFIALSRMKYIFVGLLSFACLWSMLKGPGTKYKRRMGLEGVLIEQAKNFPVIAPFVKFDPSKMKARAPGDPVPENLPIFAEALGPEEWVSYHGIKYADKKLDRDMTFRALSEQLGPRWRGAENLPMHVKALYAACALKHVRKRKDSDGLLNELSLSWSHDGGLKMSQSLKSKVNKIVKDPKIGGKLKKYVNKHAFQTTAMLRAVQRARDEGGVLSSSQFVWLRGYDRALWYPLNNLGRKSFHPEAVGAMIHYTYELIAGQKIPAPKFDDAIKGIEDMIGGKTGRRIPKRVKG